jgi:hypothetical protein
MAGLPLTRSPDTSANSSDAKASNAFIRPVTKLFGGEAIDASSGAK